MSTATMTDAMAGKFISTSEAAGRLGTNSDGINRLIRRGALTVRRLPGMRQTVLETDVNRLIQDCTVPATAK
jgi:hypothetical protein